MTTPNRAPVAQATSHDTAAPARPIRPNARRCPACTHVLDGGPVQFRCEPCRRSFYAADLPEPTNTRRLVPLGRAAA